jgi:general stress protein 26
MSNEHLSHDEQIKKLGELIKDTHVAMLTTVLPDGSLRSRPMGTQNENFDGTVWFFTRSNSEKVHEIEDDQHVNVSFTNEDAQSYVSISGQAKLNHDRAKIDELWNPIFKAFFPEGKDDPQLALLEIKVKNAEYWDAPSSKMLNLVGMATAAVTGKKYRPGDHEKVEI